MELKRHKYQGLLNVLSFNRHFYVFGLIVFASIILSQFVVNWNQNVFFLVILGFAYGLLMPLFVSSYVYDYSGFYDLDWLKKIDITDDKGNMNLNINAGFDETSFIIKRELPNSKLQVYDFYDEQQHTEPAIARARKVSVLYPNTEQIVSTKIPLEDHSVDQIFLIFAAHEIRSKDEQIQFFKECKRVCKTNGSVILVEHLRDLPNFIAFSIGFTHFFSKKAWQSVLYASGYSSVHEMKFTPFVSVFNCR